MADSILRLKVESQEYDNKLKRAAQGLTRYADECRKVGGTLEVVEKDTLDYVRALGQMDTTSRTATGKLAEMKKTFTELSVVYKNMTDQEKASPFGKALATSLDQLKGRIGESKVQLDDIKKSINGGGGLTGALDSLSDKFGMSVKSLAGWGTALAAGKAALDVAKDAFFNNEEQLDTWGRVVESSQSLYQGFLNALNNGDISGYLNNISNITRAAQNAYDALDALSTFNAFNQVNVEKTRTGMTESIVDFREGTGSKDAVKAAGDAYKKELKERQKLEKEAYNAEIRKIAAQRGISGNDLIMALSGSYGSYQSLKALPMSGSRIVNYGGGMFGGGGSYEEAIPANRQEKLGAVLRQLNDTELKSLQALGAQAERTGNEIASVDRQLSRVLNGRSGSVGGGGKGGSGGGTTAPTYAADSIAAQSALVSELTKKFNESGEAVRNGMLPELVAAEAKLKSMKNEAALLKEQAAGKLQGGWVMKTNLGADSFAKDYLNIGEGLGKDFKLPVTQVESMTEALKQQQMAFNLAGQAANGFSAALSGMEDPAAKAAGQVVSAIASIAMGFAMASSTAETAGTGWGWLAWLAAGASAMATTISTIHSLTGYAEGGIVKGNNSYSGDNVPIMANEGELVLTKAMQGNLASQMRDNGGFGDNFHAVLTGENIHIVHSRYLKRTGQGEIVTWR